MKNSGDRKKERRLNHAKMNDDVCSDWYEAEDYESNFPRAAEEPGWGIDNVEMYTSKLDMSKFTPEQIARAEALAAEIEVSHLPP